MFKRNIKSNKNNSFLNLDKKIIVVILLGFYLKMPVEAQQTNKDQKRPNILVVLVDDMGFSDLGSYGGEIKTPNIDKLAEQGIRYTQFYNTAKCHSTRVSLLTGRYPFQAGNTSLMNSVTIPEVLAQNGYFTAMVGKWHLDKEPTDFGFERYFGHLSGATNYFTGDETFRLNGEKWDVPETGFYTTIANADYGIRFLTEARKTGKPWFMYMAFNAPHFPLLCLKEDFMKYEDTYKAGWDNLRDKRRAKQKSIGLFDQEITIPERPDYIPAWDELSTERQKAESDRMAAYAALIDRLDHELGRVLDDIKSAGELDNTFILFVSDNGACPYERFRHGEIPPWNPKSGWHTGTAWAWLSNTPFRYYKQNQFEGGIATPAIASWPNGIKLPQGSIVRQPLHVIDILPTLADISQSIIPDSWPERELNPVAGISFRPTFKGDPIENRDLYFLFAEDRGLRSGPWKLVSFRENPWELYNLDKDRTEMHNVVDQFPDIAKQLSKRWYEMAENVDKAPMQYRTPLSPDKNEKLHPLWTDFSKKGMLPFKEGVKE